jgi:N-formylmaleamate deformylase
VDDWQSGLVETNSLQLHYIRTGGDKPAVVLAHGVTDDGLSWTPIAEALASDYDVIMVDARGHGRSDPAQDGYGMQEQAADLAGVITALELHQPAVLGHSMGAAATLVLAGMHPDVPGAILLEDPPAWWMGWAYTAGAAALFRDMHERYQRYNGMPREALVADVRDRHPTWADADYDLWAGATQRMNLDVLSVLEPDYPTSVDWPETLRRIACPALLITGEPTLGAIVTEASAATLHSLIPRLQIAHIPGAGHGIRRDQFAPFMQVVLPFLAEINR